MSQNYVETIAEERRKAQEAFNEGDFVTAFAGLAPDVEWHLMPGLLETGVLRNVEKIRRARLPLSMPVTPQGRWLIFIPTSSGGT